MASGSRPRPSAGACQRYRPAARTMPSSLGFPSRTDTRAHAVYPKDQPVNFDALAPAVLSRIVRSAHQLGGATRAASGEAGAASAGGLDRPGRPRSGGVLDRKSVVQGKMLSVRVELGGRRCLKTIKTTVLGRR